MREKGTPFNDERQEKGGVLFIPSKEKTAPLALGATVRLFSGCFLIL